MQEHLEKHYADLAGKGFFKGLIQYSELDSPDRSNTADSPVLSGPVVGMVWEGLDAVKTGRKMLGATNPLASEPGMY
jgi:nucleoside-diphosphate kinase